MVRHTSIITHAYTPFSDQAEGHGGLDLSHPRTSGRERLSFRGVRREMVCADTDDTVVANMRSSSWIRPFANPTPYHVTGIL